MSKMAAENQKRMAESQAKMMQRQLAMQMAMRERMIAVSIAQARDMLMFYSAFVGVVAPALLIRGIRTRNPVMLAPLVPISFVLAYQYDMAYHTKMDRIFTAADGILTHERHLLRLPGPPLTLEALDATRQDAEVYAVTSQPQLK